MNEDLDVHLPAIQAGDAGAFGLWLAAVEPSLRRGLRSFARQVDTEAVLQEALLRTWQVAPRFERDGAPNGLARLAQRIARNLAISEARRKKSAPLEPTLPEAAVEVRPPDPILREKIARCREKLPPRPKEALAARLDGEDFEPDATLAQRLGMEKNTFLQNITRARKLLLECLERAGVNVTAELA